MIFFVLTSLHIASGLQSDPVWEPRTASTAILLAHVTPRGPPKASQRRFIGRNASPAQLLSSSVAHRRAVKCGALYGVVPPALGATRMMLRAQVLAHLPAARLRRVTQESRRQKAPVGGASGRSRGRRCAARIDLRLGIGCNHTEKEPHARSAHRRPVALARRPSFSRRSSWRVRAYESTVNTRDTGAIIRVRGESAWFKWS